MKEKVIIISALTFVFATFYIGKDKISNKSRVADKGSSLMESTTASQDTEILDKVLETSSIDKESIELVETTPSSKKLSNTCNSTEDQTDKMPFNKAFQYYITCQGESSEFNWKGKPYIANLKKEEDKNKVVPTPSNSEELKSNLAMNKN